MPIARSRTTESSLAYVGVVAHKYSLRKQLNGVVSSVEVVLDGQHEHAPTAGLNESERRFLLVMTTGEPRLTGRLFVKSLDIADGGPDESELAQSVLKMIRDDG